MASSIVNEHPGRRQRTMDIMGPEFMAQYTSPFHRALKAITSFVPYSYKELKDVDLVEYSVMRQFGMIQYVTSLQRHCIPADLFFWGIFNTDASDERLLVTGTDGRPNVIGWGEIMTAFGGEHSEEDEFRGAKIMHRQLLPYRPADFLPETIKKNVNKELVSEKDYEEVLYYREAAPYGPTYYMMTLIAEVFWSHSWSNRFLMPMVYAYLRSLHCHPYNWAKAILKSLRSEIAYLQKEARTLKETRKTVQVVWAPVLAFVVYLSASYFYPDDLPKADLTTPTEPERKKLPSKKNKAVKIVVSSNSDDDTCPQKKRARGESNGPKTRTVCCKPPAPVTTVATALIRTDMPTHVRTIDDLAVVLSHDIRNVLDHRFTTVVKQLGSNNEEWKSKFDALQKEKAEEEAQLKATVKTQAQSEKKLTADLVATKGERETLLSKIHDLQCHIHKLNESCNEAKQALATQTALRDSAMRTRAELEALQAELARLKHDRASWQLEKAKLCEEISTVRANKTVAVEQKEAATRTQLKAAVSASEHLKNLEKELGSGDGKPGGSSAAVGDFER
ncbi:hypothetical protein R1sor_022355 [Riccia sorocarpa]|uniref:Uncharacterized protein n=1 Tax=Riccia sorocarpa TaxID=122646 RepID=A0ABD3GQG8_9MARC